MYIPKLSPHHVCCVLTPVLRVLALFGDQFARQFASESLTLLDHVIFACVPLGIVTALIGAIRVQGPKFAKAFIGRARENRSTVELELMSSTSDNVCEMFSGRGVVRTLGRPRLKQIIILPDIYNTFQEDLQKAIATSSPNDINHDEKRYTDVDASCGIHTLDTAYGLESSGGHSGRIMEWEGQYEPGEPEPEHFIILMLTCIHGKTIMDKRLKQSTYYSLHYMTNSILAAEDWHPPATTTHRSQNPSPNP